MAAKSNAIWWVLGGAAVLGAGTALYFATKKPSGDQNTSLPPDNTKGGINIKLGDQGTAPGGEGGGDLVGGSAAWNAAIANIFGT